MTGMTAEFTGTGEGDLISAKITDKGDGKGAVLYNGSGTITVTNSNNDYTGETKVDAGVTVIADAKNALGKTERVNLQEGRLEVKYDQENVGGLTVADNATFTINSSQDSEILGTLSGTGTLIQSSLITLKKIKSLR